MKTVFTHGGPNPFTDAKAAAYIQVDQSDNAKALFTVTYGLERKEKLTYAQAAEELGLCLFHHLACEGVLHDDGE